MDKYWFVFAQEWFATPKVECFFGEILEAIKFAGKNGLLSCRHVRLKILGVDGKEHYEIIKEMADKIKELYNEDIMRELWRYEC